MTNPGSSQITQSIAFSILEQLPGYVMCSDKGDRYTYCNNRAAYMAGYKNNEEIFGEKFSAMPCKAAECSDDFVHQNHFVLENKVTLKILDIHPYRNNTTRVLLTYKMPLVNEKNEDIGVIAHANDINQHTLLKVIATLTESDKKFHSNKNTNQRNYIFCNEQNVNQLSNREMECLFYIIRGKTAKQIASILMISHRTVEAHVKNIRDKLNCTSKSDLIEYAVENGFNNYIPSDVLNNANINISAIIE